MSVVAAKIATLVRCIERARAERTRAGDAFATDFTRQDAAVLNVMRACEAAVDLANMLIRKERLGLPGDMRESFVLLERGGFVPPALSERLQKMIGFRNIAVHQYRELDLDIVESVIAEHLDDLLELAEAIRPRLADERGDDGSDATTS